MNDISGRLLAAKKRRRTKAVLFVLLFILIGGVIGAGATLLYMKSRFRRIPPSRDAIVARMIGSMKTRVDIAADEEKRLAELLESHFDEILDVREQSFRSMQEVFRRMDAGVESVLGAERFGVWNRYKEERMEHWRKRYERKR